MSLLRLADPIEHQTQPTPTSCVPTCLAMALGMPVAELVAAIRTISIERAYAPETFAVWLAERGVWMRPLMRGVYGEGARFHNGAVYLVGVRSLNIVNADHSVLLDTRPPARNEPGYNERSGWRLYDPNAGRESVKCYEWVDEYNSIDAHELRCRSSLGGAIGDPP